MLRDFELAVTNIDRNNLPRACNPRTLNHRDAHAACAKYSNARSGRHLRGIQCRTDAGRHCASEQRRAIQRDIVADF